MEKSTCCALTQAEPQGLKDPRARSTSNPAATRKQSPTGAGIHGQTQPEPAPEQWAQEEEAKGAAVGLGHHLTAPRQESASTSLCPPQQHPPCHQTTARMGSAGSSLPDHISSSQPPPSPSCSETASAAPVTPTCHCPSTKLSCPSEVCQAPQAWLVGEPPSLCSHALEGSCQAVGHKQPQADSSGVSDTYIKKQGTMIEDIKNSW